MATFAKNIPVMGNSVNINTIAAAASNVAPSASWILASKVRAYAVLCQTGYLAASANAWFGIAYSSASTGANMTVVSSSVLSLATITTVSTSVLTDFVPSTAVIPSGMYWSPYISVTTAAVTAAAMVFGLDVSQTG